jgi:hypothetical protein
VEALRKKAIQDKTHFTTKIVGKLVWVSVTSLCKIYIPSHTSDALLSRNWPISHPNRGTLRITLIAYKNYLVESLSSFCKPWTLFLCWPQFHIVLIFSTPWGVFTFFIMCSNGVASVLPHISFENPANCSLPPTNLNAVIY